MGENRLVFGEDDAKIQVDPWELPTCFVLRRKSGCKKQKSLRTPSGYWKEKEGGFIGIRSRDESSSSSGSPSYVAVRKTFEFFLKDGTRGAEGTKTDWIFHEYHNLRKVYVGSALFLEEDVVTRKVFKRSAIDETYSLEKSLLQKMKESSRKLGNVLLVMMCHAFRLTQKQILEPFQAGKAPSSVTSEGLREDLGAQCHPDGKPDNVWNHFTKIRTDDPDVVYAVCHHCDKVLKAHSKRDGTSPLRRHRNSDKCRSSCGNPSTDEDREMLRCLREEFDRYEQQRTEGKLECQEVNAHLTQLNPCVLGHNHNPWYVTTSLNRQTNEGCWEEIGKEFTAIRTEQQQMEVFWMEISKGITTAIQNDYQMQMQVPQYMGLRRTLEFHLSQNGNKLKTGWIMLEYQQADAIESPALSLKGDMVIRKLFHYDKDAVSAIFRDFDRSLNGDNDNVERYNGKGVNPEITTSIDYMNGGGDRKRKRSAAS